jgi:hypothetical protein
MSDPEMPPQSEDPSCQVCGWVPVEGMKAYMRIHGDEAMCMRCGRDLNDPPPQFVEDDLDE